MKKAQIREGAPMSPNLAKLTEMARHVEMTPQQREEQRRSFAYGSAVIENSDVTRESITRAAEEIESGRRQVVDQRSEHGSDAADR